MFKVSRWQHRSTASLCDQSLFSLIFERSGKIYTDDNDAEGEDEEKEERNEDQYEEEYEEEDKDEDKEDSYHHINNDLHFILHTTLVFAEYATVVLLHLSFAASHQFICVKVITPNNP